MTNKINNHDPFLVGSSKAKTKKKLQMAMSWATYASRVTPFVQVYNEYEILNSEWHNSVTYQMELLLKFESSRFALRGLTAVIANIQTTIKFLIHEQHREERRAQRRIRRQQKTFYQEGIQWIDSKLSKEKRFNQKTSHKHKTKQPRGTTWQSKQWTVQQPQTRHLRTRYVPCVRTH